MWKNYRKEFQARALIASWVFYFNLLFHLLFRNIKSLETHSSFIELIRNDWISMYSEITWRLPQIIIYTSKTCRNFFWWHFVEVEFKKINELLILHEIFANMPTKYLLSFLKLVFFKITQKNFHISMSKWI